MHVWLHRYVKDHTFKHYWVLVMITQNTQSLYSLIFDALETAHVQFLLHVMVMVYWSV